MNASFPRILRIQNKMIEHHLDALYVRSTSNIWWATAFHGVFDSESAHALLVFPHKVILHSDSRYGVALNEALEERARVATNKSSSLNASSSEESYVDIELSLNEKSVVNTEATLSEASLVDIEVDISRKHHFEVLLEELQSISTDENASFTIGVEDTITLNEFRKLEQKIQEAKQGAGHVADQDANQGAIQGAGQEADSANADTKQGAGHTLDSDASSKPTSLSFALQELSGFTEELRQVKDAEEIACMKKAQAITDEAFSHIITYIQPGMSEKQVQQELDQTMASLGAEGLAFSSIVASGPRGAMPHSVPGDDKLAMGECIVMDFGARYHGYCSDMTRTVFLGKPSQRMKDAWNALVDANETCEALIKQGLTGKFVHDKAEDILAQHGFAHTMGHSLGHSVGLDIHESPNLSPLNQNPLAVGNVVTVEPGIYIAGEFGMRLEDFGVVGEDGFEVITQSSHEMVIIYPRDNVN